MGSTVPSSIVVLHEAFARRMKQACDSNDDIPPLNEGRLVWIQQQMAYQGHEVSLQTAMRWYYGAAIAAVGRHVGRHEDALITYGVARSLFG